MPFEVIVNFPRGSAYFAGEQFTCHISVCNRSTIASSHRSSTNSATNVDNNNSPRRLVHRRADSTHSAAESIDSYATTTSTTSRDDDTLALLTAQIVSQQERRRRESVVVTTRSAAADPDSASAAQLATSGAFQPTADGDCLATTDPCVLACDILIPPGCERTFTYQTRLPNAMAASFRGHYLRYVNRLAVGCQRLRGAPTTSDEVMQPCKMQIVRGSLWILPRPRPSMVLERPLLSEKHLANGELLVASEASSDSVKYREDIMQLVDSIAARRRTPLHYRLSAPDGSYLATLTLWKQCFKIGEDIGGVIDLSASSGSSCAQVSVALESEELSIGDDGGVHVADPVAQQSLVTMCLRQCHFCIPVPLYVTPSFESASVRLRWRLHFRFLVARERLHFRLRADEPSDTTSVVWEPPRKTPTTTLDWHLPVDLVANDPILLTGVHSPEMILGNLLFTV